MHADSIGGNNPLGRYTFSGYATASHGRRRLQERQPASSAAMASRTFSSAFLQATGIQAGLFKDYLRENVYDGYITDDWRARGNLTLNYGLRYEYFGPYTEKNGRLVNLTGITSNGFRRLEPLAASRPPASTTPRPHGTITLHRQQDAAVTGRSGP